MNDDINWLDFFNHRERQHANFYLNFAQQHARREPTAYQNLEAESGNLLKTVTWLAEQHQPNDILQLATALWQKSDFMRTRGFLQRGLPLLEQAHQAARELRNPQAEFIWLEALAQIYLNTGNPTAAQPLYEQALTLAQANDELLLKAQAELGLGRLLMEMAQLEQAAVWLKQALTHYRQSQAYDGEIETLVALGNLLSLQGNFGEAVAYLEHGLPLTQIQHDRHGEMALCYALGQIRDEFRAMWHPTDSGGTKGVPIRLRLIYPHPQFDTVEETAQTQISELTLIPWEYIFLPQDDLVTPNLNYFLALRDDISLVHCLRSAKAEMHCSAHLDSLPLKLKYLSSFGAGENNQAIVNKMFDIFKQKTAKLTRVVDCTDDIIAPTVAKAELALQSCHFVHLTCHSDPRSLWLEAGNTLTIRELLKLELTELPKLKVLLLLSCDSVQVAAKISELNIPIVIGMTGTLSTMSIQNFITGFYHKIAIYPSSSLEQAVIWGRRSMLGEDNNSIIAEELERVWQATFGLPRLFLNGQDSVLIPELLLYDVSREMVEGFNKYFEDLVALCKKDNKKNQEILTKLENWLKDSTRHWFFLTGQSGSGKSTLIAQLVKNHQAELIYHFCLDKPFETADPNSPLETNDPLAFVRDSLVPQLAEYFGAEKYYSWCPSGKFPLLTDNADDALINFVYHPLFKAKQTPLDSPLFGDEGKGRVGVPIIVIDGLDAASSSIEGEPSDDTILHLLLRHRDMLNDVASFLITADDGNEAIRENILSLTLQSVPDAAMPSPPTQLSKELIQASQTSCLWPNKQDSCATETEKFLTLSQQLSMPLFYKLANRFLENDFFEFLPPPDNILSKILIDSDYQPAQFVGQLIAHALAAVENKLVAESIQLLLSVVVLAYEPLYTADVAAIIGLPLHSQTMMNLLNILKPFFGEDDKLVFYHSSIKPYMRKYLPNKIFILAHQYFVEAFRPQTGHWADANWSDLTNTRWQIFHAPDAPTIAPRYARRYLIQHTYQLYQATAQEETRSARAADFLQLLDEPTFRAVRFAEWKQKFTAEELSRLMFQVRSTEIVT